MKYPISTANSRTAINWKLSEYDWQSLLQKLKLPTRTRETVVEYEHMEKKERDRLKDVGGFVAGTLRGGRRKSDCVVNRSLITLDADNIPKNNHLFETLGEMNLQSCVYSTHSHNAEHPRFRFIIALSRLVSPEEYQAVSRRVAADIGIDIFDDTTYQAHRLMYWPSCSLNADYVFKDWQGAPLDVDQCLAKYANWKDVASWPTSQRQQRVIERNAAKQGDPLEKPGVVGAFCRVYSIHDAIAEFLSNIYEQAGESRYTLIAGTAVGGAVVYDDKFLFSHHATDPACERLLNAFDLVRVHKFGDKDERVNQDTPINKYPSVIAMTEFATQQQSVRVELLSDALEDDDTNVDWHVKLEMDAKGHVSETALNALLILLNHEAFKGKLYNNVFLRGLPFVITPLPWDDRKETRQWTDEDSCELHIWMESSKYRIASKGKIDEALMAAFSRNRRDPVREYLEGLRDYKNGMPYKLETHLSEMLGAEDNEYTRAVSAKFFIGMVARALNPGCKLDTVLVLCGDQGGGKSSWGQWLAGEDYFSDSLGTFSGNDAYDGLVGKWLVELSDLSAMRRSEIEVTKSFLSKQHDFYRAAYARFPQQRARRCVFVGTTNDMTFLHDPTGSRRFLPVAVNKQKGLDNLYLRTPELRNRLFAEAVYRYKRGESVLISRELSNKVEEMQQTFTEQDAWEPVIMEWMTHKLPIDWDERGMEDRMLFWQCGGVGTEERTKVCPLEVWCECFGKSKSDFDSGKGRRITAILTKLNWQRKQIIKTGMMYSGARFFIK
ncbi:MAG: virulence-associated E family protein [Oscillospiraceae bacterium]|nr:virulence-associated E family protein [Oscillospiraceae bacterium]